MRHYIALEHSTISPSHRGPWLMTWRLEYGWTQHELAQAIKISADAANQHVPISARAISKWELQEAKPSSRAWTAVLRFVNEWERKQFDHWVKWEAQRKRAATAKKKGKRK